MKVQMFLFALIGLWGAYNLTGPLMSILQGMPLVLVGSGIVTFRLWRVQILQRRQFVFFKDWFLWGMFSWIGNETPIARKDRLNRENQYE